MPWGTHFCQFYKTPQDLIEILVPYFKAGLEANEYCMWVTSEPLAVNEAEGALRRAMPDFDRYVRAGAIDIIPHTEWYLKGGSFDQDRVLHAWVERLEAAMARGFAGLRLSGNTFWLEPAQWKGFYDYEAAVDDVIGNYRMIALCTYSVEKCGASEVIDVVQNHQCAVVKREGRWALIEDTQRKRAEEERAASRYVRSLLEASLDPLVTISPEGEITDVNEATVRATGVSRADLIGTDFANYFSEPRKARGGYRQVFAKGFVTDYPLTIRHRDGRMTDVLYNASVYKDARGTVLGVFAAARDITERKRAEEALRESEAKLRAQAQELAEDAVRKDQFIATLAHELRNPLAPIRNAFEIIKRIPDRATALSAVAMGERQMAHLVRLVDDLLDISRITRGKIALQRERVTLQAVVEAALETSRPYVEAGGQTLTVELPSEPVLLDVDLTRIAQAISNLLINATKFTERNGQIRLTARREKDELTIAVADDGMGIGPAMLPRVFDLFAQAEGAGSRGRGLGIGLPLVRSLVELHGGRVEAASAGLGQGTTFTIHLLAAPALVTPETPSLGQAQTAAAPFAPRRILVVDDDSDVVRSTSLLLRSYGHEVCTAANGTSAIQTALEQRPDVVLLDIGLPDMDGYEVARRLRAEPELRGARLIALTGRGQEKDRKRSSDAGFVCHLVKPVDPARLEAIVREAGSEAAEPAVAVS